MNYLKFCKGCGHPFQTNIKTKIYCSEKCKRLKIYSLVCDCCGLPFESNNPNKNFCSKECRHKAREKLEAYHHTVKLIPDKPKPKISIKEVIKLAEAEHLTYGEYVQKYKI